MKLKTMKSYSTDFILSIVATLLSTGTMQLFLLPQLSQHLSSADYGVMLTATGFMNILINAFGSNLCNSRLKQHQKYVSKNAIGDYQILLIATLIISTIAVMLFNLYLKANFVFTIFPLALITITGICKTYYLVAYRLTVNYKLNLIAHLLSCIGYVFGGLIILKHCSWPWTFLLGDIFALAFIFFSSHIVLEPLRKTDLFASSAKVTSTLLVGGLIGNITMYLDRFIIYPTLGSESVSTYSTAAWFSKSVLLVVSPITSVLLSYISTGKLKLDKKKYDLICVFLFCIVFLCWGLSIIIAPIVTGWMYPTLVDAAKPYIAYVSLSVVIGIIGNFLAVIVFAYAPVKWQTIIPIIKVLCYLFFGLTLVNTIGIMGMIIGVFAANFVSIVVSFFVAQKWVGKELEI